MLAGHVGRKVRHPLQAPDGGLVDDRRAAAHERQERSRKTHHAADVIAKQTIPPGHEIDGAITQRCRKLRPRIVDQYVDIVPLHSHPSDRGRDRGVVREFHLQPQRFARQRIHHGRELRMVAIQQHQTRALRTEGTSQRGTDASGSAGEHHHPPFEPIVHAIRPLRPGKSRTPKRLL